MCPGSRPATVYVEPARCAAFRSRPESPELDLSPTPSTCRNLPAQQVPARMAAHCGCQTMPEAPGSLRPANSSSLRRRWRPLSARPRPCSLEDHSSVIARPQRRSTLLNSTAIHESSSNLPPRTLFRIQAVKIARSSPDFLFAVRINPATCAAFIKESRMKFINAHELHRKSGSAHRMFDVDRNGFGDRGLTIAEFPGR